MNSLFFTALASILIFNHIALGMDPCKVSRYCATLVDLGYRTYEELLTVTEDDCRNTLIVELNGISNEAIGKIQGYDQTQIVGKIYTANVLELREFRTADELKQISTDDQRNTLIVEANNLFNGLYSDKLQGWSDRQIACLMNPASSANEVCTVQRYCAATFDLGYRSIDQILDMSEDDCRNTLIAELNKISNEAIGTIQGYDQTQVIGKIYTANFLEEKGIRSEGELKQISTDNQRNTLIVEANNCFDYLYSSIIQGFNDREIVCLAESSNCNSN